MDDNTDVELQAMIQFIAWDRMLGTLENYPLYGGIRHLERDIPTVKNFIRLIKQEAETHVSNERYEELYSKASEIVRAMTVKAAAS